MAGMWLGYPFDEAIFMDAWAAEPDPVLTAMYDSGAVVNDPLIAGALTGKGNSFEIPFYHTLAGTPVNHDGQTNVPAQETTGDYQSGVAYGRDAAFTARDFVPELTGSDPMGHIISSVARFWGKNRQSMLIGILGALFGITGDTEWAKHSQDLTGGGSPVLIDSTTLNDVMTAALGDNKGAFSLAVLHSNVAKTLENLQQLEFWKYTDANGVQRPMRMASVNGLTAIVDDGVPVVPSDGTNPAKYTTYLLGSGVIRYAPARQETPVETVREALVNNGQDTLVTRIREALHPNGFSYIKPTTGWTNSPTDAQLFASAQWKRMFDAKSIPMAQVITNG